MLVRILVFQVVLLIVVGTAQAHVMAVQVADQIAKEVVVLDVLGVLEVVLADAALVVQPTVWVDVLVHVQHTVKDVRQLVVVLVKDLVGIVAQTPVEPVLMFVVMHV